MYLFIAPTFEFLQIVWKGQADNPAILKAVQCINPSNVLSLMFPPEGQQLFDGGIRQIVVRIYINAQFCVYSRVGAVIPGMHSAIFFIEIHDLKPIFCPLPALHDILCLVGGPIINNKPHKIFAALAAEALIAPMQAVRPVIGWGEYCNGRHILPTFELLHSPCTRGTGPDIPRAGPLHTAAALFDSQHCNAEATAFPASPAPVRAPPAR